MSGKTGGKNGGKRPIIVKREEVVEGGHHGGAWKVAYADFVTAMMAFFLLMWLLNATTEEQRRGLADYFSPMNPLARGASGAGQPFGGKTPFETGELVSDRGTMAIVAGRNNEQPDTDEPLLETSMAHRPLPTTEQESEQRAQQAAGAAGQGTGQPAAAKTPPGANGSSPAPAGRVSPNVPVGRVSPDAKVLAMVGTKSQTAAAIATRAATEEAAMRAEQDRRERAAFDQAAEQIRDAVRGDRLLADLAAQIAIDQTPEGLRIQLLDEDRKPMFALGSTVMTDRARQLLLKMAPVLAKLSEPIAIAGNTDATPFRNGERGNWELSAERANATRRLLVDAGLEEGRIRSVTGNADRDLLLPADPMAAANRRIAITVLRGARKSPAADAKAAVGP